MTPGIPTVVVVDDAENVRTLVKAHLLLSRRLDVVAEGADGVEAIELAARHRPDLLLLDVSMPRMDGLEALPRILEASPHTRVVMFTGFDARGLKQPASDLGAAALFEKSLSVRTLADDLIAILTTHDLDVAPAASPLRADDNLIDVEVSQPGRQILEEHLESFREVFEQAAIGLGTMTLTGRLVRANKALADLVRQPVADLVGRSYTSLMAEPGPSRFRAAVEQLTGGGLDAVQLEHGLLRSGDARHVLATLAPVRDTERRSLYLFIQVQDVTAQRATEEALRQSEERFRLLVETVVDYAIFMLDPDGSVVSWNAGAQRLKGYGAEEIFGQHFRVFYSPPLQAARHPEHELELALRDGHYEEEGWRVRKDGSQFWANVVITAVYDASGTHIGFAKVTRDVTDRRRMLDDQLAAAQALASANDELAVANDRLARAADNQAQFLAVTAHELRTPVGVLGGSAELLRTHWRDLGESEREEFLRTMSANATRLRRLLDDLLTAGRLEADAVELLDEDVDIKAVLTTAVGTAARQSTDAELTIDAPDDLHLRGDSGRIAQAVDNLVNNALRHGRAPVRVSAGRRGGFVEIRVADSGPGVSAELVPRLFNRFATGAHRGGTGLGLFIVRELARAHGGDAWYEPPDAEGDQPAFVLTVADTSGCSDRAGTP